MKNGSLVFGLTVLGALHAPAQDGDKVEQYRGMLLKRPENAVVFGRLVDAWLEKGEMAGLKDYLEAKAKEGGAMDWRLLAVYRNYAGDEAGAVAALDEAVKISPDDARARLARAKALATASRFDDALADLDAAAKDPAVAMEAGTLRGKFLARAGRPADAVKAWKEIIAANPADEGLREDMIELEIGEGLMDEAVVSARELADKTADPYQKALRRMRVAEILALAGKKNEAIAEYTEVFGVSAEASWLEREVLARAGALFTREDDTAGLRDFHQKLRDTWPRRVAVKKEAARSLMATGEGDEAVAMFREVLKVMPGDREVREEFIAMLEGGGRMKDAADELTALLAANDQDAALWEKLAGFHKALNDEAGMKSALDRAVALAADDETGRITAASLLERFERKEDAERVLREAAAKFGIAGAAGDALATSLANHGKREEAVKLWQEMGKTADREGLLRITRSLTANGQPALAYEILTSRAADFKEDPLLLAALCQAAQFSDKPESAIPQAFELVRQAKTSGDLENAVRQAVGLVFRVEEPRKWIDQLQAKENPSTQELCLLSEMIENLGDSIEAEKILKKAMDGGDPLLAAAQRVRLFEYRGEMEAAVAAIRDWMALPGGLKTEQIKRLVGLYERMDNLDAALKEIDNWKRIAPGDKIAWTTRADLLRREGKPEEAVAELRRALAKFGADEEMKANLASTMMEAGLSDEAGRLYATLHDEAETPASKVKWAGQLAELAGREGKEDELVADFKRRARENPSSVAPLLALAEIYRTWQRLEEEKESIYEASRRKPDDVSLIQRLSDLEEQAGSTDKAEALLRSAIRLQDSAENRRRLSAFWIRNGDAERGLNELLADKGNTGPRDIERIVEPMMTAGDHEGALRLLAAEAPRHPEDWRLAYLHALALKECGSKDEAFTRFADLLGEKKELQGLTPLMNRNNPYGGQQRDEVSGYAKFVQLQMMTATNNNRRRGMYYGMGQAQTSLPGTVNELHWMAACHALDIAKEDPATRDARIARLSAEDLPELEVIKSAYWMKPDELVKRIEADDADPRLMRWYIEVSKYGYDDSFRSKTPANQAQWLKFAQRVAEKDPELALQVMGRFPISGENSLGADGAKRMLEIIVKLPAEKQMEFSGSLQMLVAADEKTLDRGIRDQALALLQQQLKAMREKNGNTWIEESLAMQWMKDGRFDEAVDMLNSSYEFRKIPRPNPRQGGNQGPWQQMGYRGYYQGNQDSLKFPEILSSQVNYQIQSHFRLGSNRGGYVLPEEQKKILGLLGEKDENFVEQPSGKSVDPAPLAKVIPRIQDPYQRVFFAQVANKPDLVKTEIDALVKSLPDDPMALLVSAAYQASVAKDPVKTYELLVKASAVAKTGDVRLMIDSQLYQTGLRLAAQDGGKVDLEPARRAALRMRKTMGVDDESKRQLAEGLKKLGLEEEGKRFVSAPLSMRSGSYRSYGMPRYANPSRSNKQQLAALVAQGKREAAARQVLREIAASRSAQAQAYGGYSSDDNRFYESITSLKLEEDVIKAGAPPEGAGFKTRREYALLLARINKPAAALPVLRKLAEEKPDDFEVRAAMLMALPKEEQKTYVLELPDAKFDADRIGGWFSNNLESGGSRKVDEYLANVELLVLFMEKLPVSFDAERNLTWVNYISLGVFQNYYFSDVRLKPLRSDGGGGSDHVNEAKTKQRDELASRLYQAMLRHPQTSEQGFMLMAYHQESLRFTKDQLYKAAGDALAHELKRKEDTEDMRHSGYNGRQRLWVWMNSKQGSRSRGGLSGSVDPMSYLLQNAAEGQGADPVSPEALAKIAETDPQRAKLIRDCLKVIETPGMAAFDEWKAKVKDAEKDQEASIRWLSRLAYFRKRADVLDAAMEFTCDLALESTQDYGRQTELGSVLALGVSRAVGIKEKTKAIEKVTRRLLGPPEAWSLYGDRSGAVSNKIQTRMNIYQQLVEPLRAERDDLVAFGRFAAEHRMWIANYFQIGSSSYWRKKKDTAETLKDWRSSGVFAPGPALACGRSEGEGILAEALANAMSSSSNSDEVKKFGEELLKVEGEDRFWARMVGARLMGKPKPAFAEMNANAKLIAKWPPHAKEGLVRLAGDWFPESKESLDPGLKRMVAELGKTGDAEARKRAEGFLKDGFDQNVNPYSFTSGDLGKVFRSLVSDDPELAARLWAKALDHFDATRGGGSSSSNGFVQNTRQYANNQLFQVFGNGDVSLSDVAEFIRLLEKEKPGTTSGMFNSEQSYYISQFFDRWIRNKKGEFAAMKALGNLKPESKQLAGTMCCLREETPKEAMGIAAGLFLANVCSEYSDTSRGVGSSEFADWVRKNLVKDAPMLADAALTASISQKDSGKVSDAEKAEFRKAFNGIMKQPSIPADLKLMSMFRLLGKPGPRQWLDEADSATVIADTLVQAITPGTNWASSGSFATIESYTRFKNIKVADAARVMASVKAAPVSFASSGNYGVRSEARMARFMLSLALKAEAKEELSKLVRQGGSSIRRDLGLARLLWEAGQNESAVSVLARPGEYHLGSRARITNYQEDDEVLMRFDRELETALPAWLASIGDAGQRFRVECLWNCLQDAKGDAAPSKPRRERVAALVARYPKEAPTAKVSREEMLAAFTVESTELIKPLADEYLEVAGRVKLGELVPLRDSNTSTPEAIDSTYVTEPIIRRGMRFEIENKGTATMVCKQLDSIVGAPNGNQEYIAREMMEDVGKWYPLFLIREILKRPVDQRADLAAQALKISELLLLREDTDLHRVAIALAIASQAAGGDGARVDAWLETLNEPMKSRYAEFRAKNGFKSVISVVSADPFSRDDCKQVRKDLVAALLSDKATLKRDFKVQNDYTLQQVNGLISNDDMIAVIDSVSEGNPNKVQLLVEKGGITAWSKNQNEEAAKCYLAAEEAAGSDAKLLAYAKAHHLVFINGRLKDPKQARELAKTIQVSELPDYEKGVVEKTLKETEKLDQP